MTNAERGVWNAECLAAYVAVAALAAATPAFAQSPSLTERAYMNADGGVKMAASGFSGVTHPVTFVEPATVNTTYEVTSAPGLDVSGGVRVWRKLTLGAGVSRFVKAGSGTVAAQVPHPFFVNKPRAISGDASGLDRNETALHVLAGWALPLSSRSELMISGGPSYFSVGQDVVSDVTFDQSYPYDTATYRGAVTQRRSASHAGFNAGADFTYLLRRHVGIGGSAMFSQATVTLGDTKARAGGAQVGGGLRLRF
jgi:hypothetical protein